MKNNKDRSSYPYRKTAADTQDGSVIKVYVFRGDEYIGWDCFGKTRIYIGRSKDADLVLDDPGILDTQAILSINGDLMTVFGQDKGCGVCVNGSSVTTSTLEQFDFITIGPYTLKIKLQKIKEQQEFDPGRINSLYKSEKKESSPESVESKPEDEELSYHPACHPESGLDIENNETVPEEIARSDSSTLEPDPVNTTVSSFKTKENSEEEPGSEDIEADVIDEVFSSASQLLLDGPSVSEAKQKYENIEVADDEDENENETQKTILLLPAPEAVKKYPGDSISIDDGQKKPTLQLSPEDLEDEEDEEDEGDLIGLFSLKDKLLRSPVDSNKQGKRVLEVIKFRQDSIIDIQFLDKNNKYYATTNNHKQFCIAENKKPGKYYCFFNSEQFTGKVFGRDTVDIAHLCSHENLYSKRKNIYRCLIPPETEAAVILSDGYYGYSLRSVNRSKVPNVKAPPRKKDDYYKHLARSSVFHIIALFVAGLFFSLSSPPEPEEPESRFVKIDTRQMPDFKKKVVSVKKKLKPHMASKPAKKTFKKSASSKVKTTRKKYVSRSPKAGGGSKNGGNVINRNVNVKQAGILSALGISDGLGLGAKEALAAVTNLDAIRSPNSNAAKLKVAGLVGKLGDSKIAVPSVGLINTKGSTAVIRSAGIEGNGRIAALEKGKTGQNQVMAMVSADLSKTVRIQGGMSREAVKKVIDQHMDEISYCYETALIANPSLMGKAIFEWKILMPGTVGEVRIKSSSIKSTDIHSCIKSAIKSWQFPMPKGAEVMVSYPFIFDVVGF